jgi:D-tyrosyl-tRNA(Tyr) deacylase
MKVALQRVTEASVKVDGQTVSSIDKGYVALLDIGNGDTKEKADKMVEKIKSNGKGTIRANLTDCSAVWGQA